MKKVKIILLTILVVISCFASGCSFGNENNSKQFGMFTYDGHHLTTYANKEITATEAKHIIKSQHLTAFSTKDDTTKSANLFSVNPSSPVDAPVTPDSLVTSVLQKYAGIQIVTKYYVTGVESKQKKEDLLQGTDFKYILEKNEFVPFSQLIAKGILIFDELVDYMEAQNTIFVNSEVAKVAPFKTIFSYHKGDTGNIVIQTRDFAEIPSSVGGGIGCSYRQDTEIVYDVENKLTNWQTSLGVYSATPEGTILQGYILEVELNWIAKV